MGIEADIVVVGAGSAGLGAAFAARRKGASVALIERRRLGGECTWAGCVPSKALIERAREVHWGRQRGLVGQVDFGRIMDEVHTAMERIGEDESRPTLEALGMTVLEGQASLTGPRRLSVDGTAVTARRAVILATGSTAALPPVEGLGDLPTAGIPVLTNDTVFEQRILPRRLAVIGGGPIGVELAQAFARLGSAVTLFGSSQLLPREEPEVATVLMGVFTAEGVRIATGAHVTRATAGDGVATLENGEGVRTEADAVLVAAGRQPVTDGLGLDGVGMALDRRGAVVVDGGLRTSVDGVFAIGDVTAQLQFTHAAYEMGAVAVANALGRRDRSFDTGAIPWATFTDPEVGRVGLTEAEAAAAHGGGARVAYLPMADTDRARAAGRTEGFVKLIAGPRGPLGNVAGGALLGATVVCPTGGDVVHEAVVLMRSGGFAGRLAQAVHAYPTWSMAVRECAAQFFFTHRGRAARPARRG